MFRALQELLDRLERDPEAKVIVFDSANLEFFIAHFDLIGDTGDLVKEQVNGLHPWPGFTTRLAAIPVLSISAVRGRARGVGSEFALATDIRFASKERALFQQPELPIGLLPGGGAVERLPRLVGRSRALEIILGSDEFNAQTAERYGWINRAVEDAEFDDFIDSFARRVARFDRSLLARGKELINARADLPTGEELMESEAAFLQTTAYPTTLASLAQLEKDGLQERSDLELNMAAYFDRRSAYS